jgi:hypothetical protein
MKIGANSMIVHERTEKLPLDYFFKTISVPTPLSV